MNAWGWALIHFLWQGAVIALALAVVLRAWRAKGPEFRYAAACVALAVMALAPVATALLLAGSGAGKPAVWVNEPVRSFPETLEPLTGTAAALPLDWLVALWAAGAAALLLRACGGWYVARRRTLSGIPLDYPLSRLMERMEMTGVVELMESAVARTPQVFGWLRPVIVVPAAALARLSPSEFEAVLAHELAHIRRRDYLVNLAQTVVESVLFYHPAVWWVSRRIREERELCCDDWAVRVCGDRVAYSKALIKVEEEETPMFAMAASATGLKARIARLLRRDSDRDWPDTLAPAAGVALLAIATGGMWLVSQSGEERMLSALTVPQLRAEDADLLRKEFAFEPAQFPMRFGRPPAKSSGNSRKDLFHWKLRTAEYERRVDFALRHFRDSNRLGTETDRGQTFVIYGPPDEIVTKKGAESEREEWHYEKFWSSRSGAGRFVFEGPELRLVSKPY
jgi:beta-lactamase regulating signal transducer with metallopeptidase domain